MTDRTITITPGDDQPGQHHTDPTGTIAHTGPVAGCTLPGCEQTPDTDPQVARQIRREPLAVLLSRMQRGVLMEQERDLLRAAVETELRDGDQAREQLAAARAGDAPWIKAYREDLTAAEERARKAERVANMLANAERYRQAAVAAHQGLREALRSAFGQDNSVSDDDLFECVRQQAADLTRARRGEAEAVRARETAETRARDAETRAEAPSVTRGVTCGEPGWDRQELARMERLYTAAEIRARQAEDGRVAADNMTRATLAALGVGPDTDPVIRARETLARAEKAEAEVKRLSVKLTAAQAENDGLAECMRNTDRLTTAEATELRTRAERAEATLTAVRALLPDDPRDDKWTDHVTATAVRAALGDPQPATEPEACDAYQPPTTAADSGLCASCGMYDHKHTAAAEPERPTVSVIDVLATALVAAGRRILRGETP